jgi:hypothetical protein
VIDIANEYSQTLAVGTVSLVFGIIGPCFGHGTSSSILSSLSYSGSCQTGTCGVFQVVLFETTVEVFA